MNRFKLPTANRQLQTEFRNIAENLPVDRHNQKTLFLFTEGRNIDFGFLFHLPSHHQ
jgi:hypothetical protein